MPRSSETQHASHDSSGGQNLGAAVVSVAENWGNSEESRGFVCDFEISTMGVQKGHSKGWGLLREGARPGLWANSVRFL